MVSLLQAGNLKSKSISNWGRQLSESYLDCLEDVSDPPSTPGLLQVHGRPGWSLLLVGSACLSVGGTSSSPAVPRGPGASGNQWGHLPRPSHEPGIQASSC